MLLPAGAASAATAPGTAPTAASAPWSSGSACPGPGDPCTPDLTTTRVSFTHGVLGTTRATVAAHPKIDCFYVYPTVSDQGTPNADLAADPQELSIADYQAAQFSRVCRVYAPLYRQLTLANICGAATQPSRRSPTGTCAGLAGPTSPGTTTDGVWCSSDTPRGRSPAPAHRHPDRRPPGRARLLVSAILPGGNVAVRKGTGGGGDFHHIVACRSASQTGCVIAYSTFDATPPADSVFGRTTTRGDSGPVHQSRPPSGGGTGLSTRSCPPSRSRPGRPSPPGSACSTSPCRPYPALGQRARRLHRRLFEGRRGESCASPRTAGAPVLHYSPLPTWGLHLVDVNIALGNLVGIVARESAAYRPVG